MKRSFIYLSLAILSALPMVAQSRPAGTPRTAYYTTSSTGRSYLGVDISDVTSDRVAPLKLKEARGVEIILVDQDAPAGKAGLKEHDVILQFNGTKIDGEEQFRRLLREASPGSTATLGISRDGQPMSIQIQLADRNKFFASNAPKPRDWEMPVIPEIHIPAIAIPSIDFYSTGRVYSASTGIMVESLTPQLGEFFGVKDGEGVLVRSVEKGSPAEAGGLRAGDVIVKFDGRKIADQTDWRHALRTRRSGKISLGIFREKREQVISLTLPEPQRPGDSSMLEFPSFDQFNEEMARAAMEMNRERPEIESAMREARAQMQSALDEARRELQKHQRDLQQMMRDMSDMLDKTDKD